MLTPNPDYAERLSAWFKKMAEKDAQADETLDVIRYERVVAERNRVRNLDIEAFAAWQKQSPNWLPEGYHGRTDLLTVDDVKFMIACGIDPLR